MPDDPNPPYPLPSGIPMGQRLLRGMSRAGDQLSLFVAAMVLAAYLGSIALARIWPFELLVHFRVHFAVALGVLAITQLVWRRRYWTAAYWLFAASAVVSLVPYFSGTTAAAPAGTALRLMSANLLNSNLRFSDFPELLQQVDPDVLVLIEYTYRWDHELESTLSAYPYRHTTPREHGFGMAVFSKLPLLDVSDALLVPGWDAPAIFFGLPLGADTLHCAAVHAFSPLSMDRFQARNGQLQALGQHMARITGPRLIVGDLNATIWSPFVRDLARTAGLRDSRLGLGLQTTWPQFSWWMGVAIDHVLVSPEIAVHRQWSERDIGSDHFPIVIEITAQ